MAFLGLLDTSNWAKNNHLTPLWSLIQMYYYQLWVSATWIPQKQLLKVFKILKWAHWLILLDSVTYILVIAGWLISSNFYMKYPCEMSNLSFDKKILVICSSDYLNLKLRIQQLVRIRHVFTLYVLCWKQVHKYFTNSKLVQ